MTLEQHNAKITGTMLGYEDHGVMTFYLYLEWQGQGVGFGGYVLDKYDQVRDKRFGVSYSLDCIREILETVGVEKWEDLKGKYVVVESEGVGGRAKGIRNILDENKWFRPEYWFQDRELSK